MKTAIRWCALLLMVMPVSAVGSGHYEVHAAELLEPQSCGLEIWHNNGEDANFAATSCRGDWPAEWMVEAEMPRFGREAFAAEGKYLWRDAEADAYGLGLLGGGVYDTDTEQIEETYLLVPFTTEIVDERITAHANLGATHARADDETELLWGVAADFGVTDRVTVLTEAFSHGSDEPILHGGIQVSFFNEQLFVDLSYFEGLADDEPSGWGGGIATQLLRF